MEEEEIAIMVQILKARQLGASTLTEMAVAHRVQFHPHVNAVVASSDPEKSKELSKMMLFCWDNQPLWLMPGRKSARSGILHEFDNGSAVSIQWGNQTTGIARGTTPTIAHLSELGDFEHPEELVDASLLRAMHDSPFVLLILESTANGFNWWYDKWIQSKKGWPQRRSRLRPVFLPWYLGRDLYPNPTWLKAHPVPVKYNPPQFVEEHAFRAENHVRVSDTTRKVLGEDWTMPIEQKWFFDVNRSEYAESGYLNKWYQEMCLSGDSYISGSEGLTRLKDAKNISFTETGKVSTWWNNGQKQVIRLLTQGGRELILTPRHRVGLTSGEWKEAENCMGESIQLSPPKFNNSPPSRKDLLLGRLLGFFLGDGCFSTHRRLDIACDAQDLDVINQIETDINEFIGRPPKRIERGGMTLLSSYSQKWTELFKELGLLSSRGADSRGREKFTRKVVVPDKILRAPREVVKEFLSALFECDGSVSKRSLKVMFSSCHKEFIQEIQLLLLGFGINSRIYSNPKHIAGREFPHWILDLGAQATELFRDYIGFLGKRKITRTQREIKNFWSIVPHTLSDVVIGIEPVEESISVYDLTVEDSHSYGANGILVHNCSDDLEAFQHKRMSVFQAEFLEEKRNACRPPLLVLGLQGPEDELPSRLQPTEREIDRNSRFRPLTINAAGITDGKSTSIYKLLPLKWTGGAENDPLGKIFIYDLPRKFNEYGLGIDTAAGVGYDRTVVQVVRKATPQSNAEQCAEFATDQAGAFEIWPYALALGTLYSTIGHDGVTFKPAKMVIEMAANGEATQRELVKRGWPASCFHVQMKQFVRGMIPTNQTTPLFGWKTTEATRPMMLDFLMKALKDGWLDINSPWFVDEMGNFIRNEKKERLEAAEGAKDDRIMSMGIVLDSLHRHELYRSATPSWQARLQSEAAARYKPRYREGWNQAGQSPYSPDDLISGWGEDKFAEYS